ncbi:hypothetical protein Tco_0319230 [Tanacetum coccineum]
MKMLAWRLEIEVGYPFKAEGNLSFIQFPPLNTRAFMSQYIRNSEDEQVDGGSDFINMSDIKFKYQVYYVRIDDYFATYG